MSNENRDPEIDEFINKNLGENSNDQDINNLANEPILNDVFNKEQKKNKPKTENDLQKEKAFTFFKIALIFIAILFIVFVIALIIKTTIRYNSLDDRKVVKEEEKIVEIDDNPTDFWKKKMQLRIKRNEKKLEEFQEDMKSKFENFENNSNEQFENFSKLNNENFNNFQENINHSISNILSSVNNLNDSLITSKNETKDEIKKIKKSIKQNKIKAQMPPLPYRKETVNSIKNDNHKTIQRQKKVVLYDDVDLITESIQVGKKDTNNEEVNGKSPKNKDEITIPSGYVSVITHTGIKGPTGTKATEETYPVRMEIMSDLIGANGERIPLSECFLKGVAKGDITTVRNHVTANQLYCNGVDQKGHYKIEVAISGQLYDELDGALGFPGVLVDSSGKLLTREVSLAVVQGAAQMFNNTENIIVPDVGAMDAENTSFGREFTSGVGASMSNGLSKVADYWEDILSGYYPFIDSKAARVGKVFLELNKPLKKTYYDHNFKLNSVKTETEIWEDIIE